MTCETHALAKTARQTWLAVLSRATLAQLEHLMPSGADWPRLHQVRPPEIGIVMLRGRVGGTGNPHLVASA